MVRRKISKLKGKIAICLMACMIMCDFMPTYAVEDTESFGEDIETEAADYVPGNVIVCVEGGVAALNREFDRGTGSKKLLKASRGFSVDEVLASFEKEDEKEEQKAESETEQGEENNQEVIEKPRLFKSVKNAVDTAENVDIVENKEEIILLHTDDVGGMIEKLQKLSCVKYAQPDYILETESYGGTDEPYSFAQNHLENLDGGYDIDAQKAWEAMATDESNPQVVAVMDSGVNYTHPDLKDVMWNDGLSYPELVELGGGAHGINTSGSGDTDDPNDKYVGHGTHCASVIAGAWNGEGTAGVDANLRIMACCWMSEIGGLTSNYIKAANYVIKAKSAGVNINIVNNSWGSNLKFLYKSAVIDDMTKRMGEAGIVNLFAAGNEATDLDNYSQNVYKASDMVLQIGASDSIGKAAVFSNYGEHVVDVMAPGVGILAAASLEEEIRSMPPKYYPWLSNESSILYCDMEDEEKICVKAGQSEEEQPLDDSNLSTSYLTFFQGKKFVSEEGTVEEIKDEETLEEKEVETENKDEEALEAKDVETESKDEEALEEKEVETESKDEEALEAKDVETESKDEEALEEKEVETENKDEEVLEEKETENKNEDEEALENTKAEDENLDKDVSGQSEEIKDEEMEEKQEARLLKAAPKLKGALATPLNSSVTTKRMYGKDNNHVLMFEQKYVKGENDPDFYIELTLSDDQADEVKEIYNQKKNLYLAFQIAREGEGLESQSFNSNLMIWDNKNNEYFSTTGYAPLYMDSVWNNVSILIDTNSCPELLDENNRIRMRFSNQEMSQCDTVANIYIDNIGIGTSTSDYTYASGTSMACPAAAGVLAMIIDKLKEEDTDGKTDIEVEKEAMAYLCGGTVQKESLSDKCITSGIINASNSINKQNLHPVVTEVKDQQDGTSLIKGYFFGDTQGSGAVTIAGKSATVLSWSENEIKIKNVSMGKSYAEVRVTAASDGYGRIYATLGEENVECKYEDLAPLPVFADDIKICAAGNTILCFVDEGVDGDTSIVTVWKYDTISESWSRVELPGGEIELMFGVQYEISLAAGETEIYALISKIEDDLSSDTGRLLTYDTVSDTWKYDVEVKCFAATTGALCVYNGELVLLGGGDESNISRKIYPDTGEVYDTFPGVLEGYSGGYAFQNGDNILVAGTYNTVEALFLDMLLPGYAKFMETIIYDAKNENWKESQSVFFGMESDKLDPDTWRQSCAVPLKDGLMIVGPVRNNGKNNMTDTWIYRASTDSYEAYPALYETMRTQKVASCLLDGKMYVMGTSLFPENKGKVRLASLDISEIAADGCPDVKKSPKKPDPVKPDPVKPDPVKPDPTKPNPPESNPTKAYPTESEPIKSDSAMSNNVDANLTKNGSTGRASADSNSISSTHDGLSSKNDTSFKKRDIKKKGTSADASELEEKYKCERRWIDKVRHKLTGWHIINGKRYYLNSVKLGTFGLPQIDRKRASSSGQVYLAVISTDIRDIIEGLILKIRYKLKIESVNPVVFVLGNENQNKLMLIFWDDDNFRIYYGRLDEDLFRWLRSSPAQSFALTA